MLNHFERKHEVRAFIDYFEQGDPDVEWIKTVSSWKNTAILCGDGRILKNKAEKQVLKDSNLTFVHLAKGWTTLPWPEFGWKIVKVWPDIVGNVLQASKPMIFEVSVGKLKVTSMGLTNALN